MKRVLLISYPFPPSASVGALRPLRMARYLPEFGYAVEVLTTSMGEGETDFDMALLQAIPESTVVHRIPVRHFLRRSPWHVPPVNQPLRRAWWKARSYATHLIGPLDWFALWARDAEKRAEELMRTGAYHAAIVTAPPFSSVVECAALKRRTGCPLVLDFRDLLTARSPVSGGPMGHGFRSVKERMNRRLERAAIEAADRVILNNPEALALQKRTFPELPSSKFVCVPNAYDHFPEDVNAPAPVRLREASEPVTLIHTGLLAAGRSDTALNLLRAAVQLNRESSQPIVRIVFAGTGEPGLVRKLAEFAEAQDIVSEIGWVPRQRSLELQRNADVLVALQSGSALGLSAVPAKLYEYMTAGRWILGVLPSGPAARIMREERLGEVAQWDDPADILSALQRIVQKVQSGAIPPPPSPRYAASETIRLLASVLDEMLQVR